MPCPCGVSALPRPARIRGPCSAHAIPRAGQLVGLRGGARLERVVPGRPSRVARGEGDEADAALRARGARASIAWHGAAASEELLVLVLLATVPVQGVRRFTALSLRPRATLPVRSCGRAPRFPCAPLARTPLDRATRDERPGTTGSQSSARPRAGLMCQFMQRFLNQSIFFALVASLSLTEVACGDGEKEPISGYDWGFVGVSLVCELYVLVSLCSWVN